MVNSVAPRKTTKVRAGRMIKAARTRAMVRTLTVRRAVQLPGEDGPRGHVKAGSLSLTCALGRHGLTHMKREGDAATPAGCWRLLHGFFRPDRTPRPFCRVPLKPLTRNLGWCDDPSSALYNRQHPLPSKVGHEIMWRTDGLYDVVFVLDYNIAPRQAGRGSAIFLHCAKSDGAKSDGAKSDGSKSGLRPTLGCIALRPQDMRRLLPQLSRKAQIIII